MGKLTFCFYRQILRYSLAGSSPFTFPRSCPCFSWSWTIYQPTAFSVPRHQLPATHDIPAPRSMAFSILPWVPLPPCILAPSLDLSKGTNLLRSAPHGYWKVWPILGRDVKSRPLADTKHCFVGAVGRRKSGPAFGFAGGSFFASWFFRSFLSRKKNKEK